ncbi:MAG: alanine racemase [Chloroflexota bacterium]
MTSITKPTLLLHQDRVRRNIERMARKAKNSQVRFRPHFKTHLSADVGAWFRDYGVEAITVSSLEMAIYFAEHGWQDITVAFPVNILEIETINQLASQIQLNLLVESVETVDFLAKNISASLNIWLKIDTGYGRTGLVWSEDPAIVAVAEKIMASPNLSIQGVLTHSGHSYGARSAAEIQAIYEETVSRLSAVRATLQDTGLMSVELSIGDTPCCSVVEDLSGVDEIRPGNFVFYDVTQLHIGSCLEEDIGVAVACPVVAKHPERNTIVLYGGAVHHSKEFLEEDGKRNFGYVAPLTADGWGSRFPNAYVSGLSQEHGLISVDNEMFAQINVGDVLAILPIHSCLTANLMRSYLTVSGDTLEFNW